MALKLLLTPFNRIVFKAFIYAFTLMVGVMHISVIDLALFTFSSD